MRTQREYLQTMDDDATLLQDLLIHPLQKSTKINGLIPGNSPEIRGLICSNAYFFHLGKPSIYKIEKKNHHAKMRGMVEYMDP
jgi:hypothetical protein